MFKAEEYIEHFADLSEEETTTLRAMAMEWDGLDEMLTQVMDYHKRERAALLDRRRSFWDAVRVRFGDEWPSKEEARVDLTTGKLYRRPVKRET